MGDTGFNRDKILYHIANELRRMNEIKIYDLKRIGSEKDEKELDKIRRRTYYER